MTTVRMIVGDVRDTMTRLIADQETFDLLVTSPPFLALRSYLPADHPDKHRELGSEPTPAAFLDTLYGLTADWGRLLPEWASICVELGDTMSGSGGAGGDYDPDGWRMNQPRFEGSGSKHRMESARPGTMSRLAAGPGWPLAKSMCLIPHLYTIGLAYGTNPLTGTPTPAGQWRIRNVVTWARPNPPVGSLGKRNPHKRTGDYKFRPACSYITVACRGTGRYFDLDAVRTEHQSFSGQRVQYSDNGEGRTDRNDFGQQRYTSHHPAGAPPLDWHTDQLDGDWLWKLATAPYPGSHYATYPLTLPRRLILAMCPLEVCTVCGWPRERISAVTGMVDTNGKEVERTVWASGMPNGQGAHTNKPNSGTTTTTTLGFTDCGCDADHDSRRGGGASTHRNLPRPGANYRPGHVIDPFAGSGTTAVAAALEHRDCTLIDLDPRNVELVDKRLREALNVLSVERDSNTVTWTVEAPLPAQKTQVEGQLNLL